MEEFKGTNGEWEIKTGNEENGRGKFSITTDESNIATIWDAVEEEETIHNAKLIAVAPEMLEALKDFVKAVENEDIIIYDNLDHDGFASTPSKIYQKSKKVIEKALGKNF